MPNCAATSSEEHFRRLSEGQDHHNEAQTRRTVAHPLILAWRTVVRRVGEVRAIRNP